MYPVDYKQCHRCTNSVTVKMYYDIKVDGSQQFYWFCEKCQRMTPSGIFMPKVDALRMIESLKDEQQAKFWEVRLRNNYMTKFAQPCAVKGCTRTDTQEHHIAPRSLRDYFDGDWQDYPTIYLCQDHHRLWHEIVTWYMPGYRQRFDELAAKYLDKVTA